MKRKLLIVLLSLICCFCLAFGLTACNKGTTSGGNTDNTEQSNEQNDEQTDNTDDGSDNKTDDGSSSIGGDNAGSGSGDSGISVGTEQGGAEQDEGDEQSGSEQGDTEQSGGAEQNGNAEQGGTESGDTEQGGTESDETPHVHKLVKTDATAATCIKEGNIEYWTCSDCGKYFSDSNGTAEITLSDTVTTKTAHTPAAAVKESEVAATCTAAGSYDSIIYCSVCNAEISRETVTTAMIAHTYSGYSSNENGHWQECSVCGGKTSSVSHTFENSTCTVCGYKQLVASENLDYTLSDDGTYYTVSGIGTCSDTDLVIPSTYDGKPVTAIAANAFKNQTQLTSVYVPNSVNSIYGSSFCDCTALESVTIGNGVTYIGSYVFYNTAYYNDSNNWENSVLYIANCLIEAEKSILGDYTIKDGTTVIACYAFYNCTKLQNVTIPDSVIDIGTSAFYNCTALENVTIPDSVIIIHAASFYGCTSLKSVNIGNGVTTVGNNAFRYCTSIESVTFENTDGWYIAEVIGGVMSFVEDISGNDLLQSSTAAKYLTEDYYSYYWYRK